MAYLVRLEEARSKVAQSCSVTLRLVPRETKVPNFKNKFARPVLIFGGDI